MSQEGTGDDGVDKPRPLPRLTRRRALKAGASAAGVGAIGGLGLWYGSEPSVAATVDNTGAEDVVFDTSQNVVSVAEVELAPEVAVAFDGFSKGVTQAKIAVTVTINANESSSDYSLAQDTWNAPDGDSDDHVSVTISDTVDTDGSSDEVFSYDTDSGSNSVPVQTPDLTGQKSQSLSEGENFLVGWDDPSASDPAQPLPLQKAIEQSGELGSETGKEMFPQSVDAYHYGLSVVDLAYQITLIDDDGGSDSVAASDNGQDDLAHTFDVVVQNEGGSVTDGDADSNTNAQGEDGTSQFDGIAEDIAKFEQGSLHDSFVGNTGVFEVNTNNVVSGSYSLENTNSGAGDVIWSTSGLDDYPQQDQRFACYIYVESNGSGNMGWATQGSEGNLDGYFFDLHVNVNELRVRKYTDGSHSIVKSTSVSLAGDQWYDAEVLWYSDGTFEGRVYDIDQSTRERQSQLGSITYTDTDYTSGGIGFHDGSSGGFEWYDNYRILENL